CSGWWAAGAPRRGASGKTSPHSSRRKLSTRRAAANPPTPRRGRDDGLEGAVPAEAHMEIPGGRTLLSRSTSPPLRRDCMTFKDEDERVLDLLKEGHQEWLSADSRWEALSRGTLSAEEAEALRAEDPDLYEL